MHAEQTVSDMADEVLARQAAARARWSGESFGEALDAVLRTEAGWQLQELRDGVHGSERAKEWQENLVRCPAEERVALITDPSYREHHLPEIMVGSGRPRLEGQEMKSVREH